MKRFFKPWRSSPVPIFKWVPVIDSPEVAEPHALVSRIPLPYGRGSDAYGKNQLTRQVLPSAPSSISMP